VAKTSDSRGIRAERLLGVLIGRSAPWAAAAGLACVVGYLIFDGPDAAGAALFGVALVAGFFGIDVLVLRLTRNAQAAVTAAALMAEYVVKVVVLAALLWGLNESTDLDLQATAVSVVITTIAGVVAVTMAAIRARSFYFDFPDRGSV
jgi:hypothetical protein